MPLSRRAFLPFILAAPAIVRASSLMAVKPWNDLPATIVEPFYMNGTPVYFDVVNKAFYLYNNDEKTWIKRVSLFG
jgi:hypothetical protein